MQDSEPQILIAEDNPALLRVTHFTLERAGFRVVTATDGQAALDRLAETRFGLLITDQQMPRLCGVELIREARQLPGYAETPMVLLTAKALELSHEALAEELGVARVLKKPFSPAEVSRLAGELLAATSC